MAFQTTRLLYLPTVSLFKFMGGAEWSDIVASEGSRANGTIICRVSEV